MDEDYLYILANVADNSLSAIAENAWGKRFREFFIDENNGRTNLYENDDAQYRVNYKNEKTVNGYVDVDKFQTVARLFMKKMLLGYLVEAAIPFTTIKGSVGHIMGFDLQVNDDSNADG